jgi:hypothetical protein
MQALIFVQKLKQTLLEIEANGGNRIFFVEPDYELIQQTKAYAISKLKKAETDVSNWNVRHFANDLLSRDIFNLRLRYCVIKLREFSISREDYSGYITKAIDLFVEEKGTHIIDWPTTATIDDAIAIEVSKCFQVWYRPEDVFLIDFSQDRQLIFVNPQEKNWMVSNLGNYLLQLSPFETIAFLCALEVILTLRYHQNRFISKAMLGDLLEGNSIRSRPYSLSLFGIVSEGFHDEPEVTDFGRRILLYVKDNLEVFRDVALFLLESEATGLKYPSEIDWDSILKVFAGSKVLVEAQKDSIETAVKLFRGGNYIDSLRIIYPVLEGALDSALATIGLEPSKFSGMRSKTEKLAKASLISTKVSTNLEIFSSRNKVLHGNILENDPELMRPLFSLVLAHLRLLVVELDENTSKK